uniref:Uncharacterized protein n=1 Tax=Timema cristinae TaxID=61476 RepID=A0A7R9DSG9_TIMCR|nr:unnamed protein product [Timema cristinae]
MIIIVRLQVTTFPRLKMPMTPVKIRLMIELPKLLKCLAIFHRGQVNTTLKLKLDYQETLGIKSNKDLFWATSLNGYP